MKSFAYRIKSQRKELTSMSYDYSENILVQESAGHLLADELGWQIELAYNQEILGANGTFGRSSYKDILLARYFHKALRTLNPWITDAQVIEASFICFSDADQ